MHRGSGAPGERSVEFQRLRVDGVIRLDVFGDQSHKLVHHRFHSCGVSGGIGGAEQDPIEPFVIGAHPEALPGGPLGSTRMADRETVLGESTGEIDDDGFDIGGDAFKQNPVRGP
jgi:hypothetical protein